jgi:hypothetical protein
MGKSFMRELVKPAKNYLVENCGLCRQHAPLPFLRGFKLVCETCEKEYKQMENRRRVALFNACRYEAHRHRKIYAHALVIESLPFSTILTVDDFGGFPRWHVSAKVYKDGALLNLFARLERTQLKTIADFLESYLQDAGTGPVRHRNTVTELNYFKTLSPEEREILR